jgi:hypothetical protein
MKNEIFINKAILKHNNKYDYSIVNYINSYTKVIIICPIHGSFLQIPNNHLRGSGCIDCGVINSHNKQKDCNFIDDFINANNDKYDYSLVNYIDNKTKISVICKEHGTFEITPFNHKNGIGCKKCGIIARTEKRRKNNWLPDIVKLHGDKYDYSKSKYINSKTKIEIICRNHGSFFMKPGNHLRGQICYKCAFDVYDTTTFIDKSNIIFNSLYDYTNVKYINNKKKVEIICKNHDSFFISPTNHLQGQGCPKCNLSKGELKVSKYLESNLIKYEIQKKFNNCFSNKKKKLPFDFYLPEKNICIEYDGEQHFRPIDYFGGIDTFNKQKFNDSIKDKYCLDNDIRLIRIPFNRYNDIEDILLSEINK